MDRHALLLAETRRRSHGVRAAALVGAPDMGIAACVVAAAVAVARYWCGEPWHDVATLVLAAVVAGSVALASALSRLARQLQPIETALRAMADGDFETRFSLPRHGALSEAAGHLRIGIERMRHIVAGVREMSAQCASEADETFQLGAAILDAAESTANDAASAAASAVRVSENMHLVAAASEEFTVAVQEIADHSSRAASTVRDACTDADAMRSTMAELGQASQRVVDVVDLIRRIARQTHLLALNATIEAARAGASGKGFAVVAGEVKALATETAHATDSVTDNVAGLLAGSTAVSGSIATISSVIGTVNDNQAAIATSVQQQTTATYQVARSTSEAAAASTEIARAVEELSAAIRRMAYEGARADTKAGEIMRIHQELRALVEGIRVGEMGAAAAITSGDTTTEARLLDGVIVIEDSVVGTGINEIDYVGSWSHSKANALTGGTNSYTVMPDDYAILRFEGTRVRVYVVTQHNQAVVAIRVDGGEEILFDCYSPTRQRGVLAYESPSLSRGPHTVRVRATGIKTERSTFYWTSIDRFEVVP